MIFNLVKYIFMSSVIYIMVSGFSECVHILPLGHEFDRAVRPFDTVHVNRVYLVVDTGEGTSGGQSRRDVCMDDIQKNNFTPRVKKYLEDKDIEVRIIKTRTFILEELLKTITSLIRMEKELGNDVYVNMSSSGRLAAVGAFLASAAYDVQAYYVHSERFANDDEREEHGLSICKNNKSSFLPELKFERPNETESYILEALYNAKNNKSDPNVSSMELVDYLESKSISGFVIKNNNGDDADMRKENSRRLMKLSIIMEKMVTDNSYAVMTKEGRRTMYRITELGQHAFCLCGMDKDMYSEMFNLKTGDE